MRRQKTLQLLGTKDPDIENSILLEHTWIIHSPLPPLSGSLPERFHSASYPQIKDVDLAVCKEDAYLPSGTLATFASDSLD